MSLVSLRVSQISASVLVEITGWPTGMAKARKLVAAQT